jgi:IPT/TIG domain-containing protein
MDRPRTLRVAGAALLLASAACRQETPRKILPAEPESLAGPSVPAARPRIAALYPPDAYGVVDFARGLSGSQTLGISGERFAPGCTVTLSGEPLLVSFQSPTTLHAWIPKALLAFPGGMAVTVHNPDGTSSEPAKFTVFTPRRAGACPEIRGVYPSPDGTGASGSVGVSGVDFSVDTVALLDGETLPTTFRGPTSIVATIPAARRRPPRRALLSLRDPECRQPTSPVEFDLR